MRDNGILCSVHRSSATQDAGTALSVRMQQPADNTDSHSTCFAAEQVAANRFDDGSVQCDNATVHSTSETSRRSSAAVDLNCSVVDTVSRNRCSKMQATRRKSLNEAVVANFLVAGLHDSKFDSFSEQCQRSAGRRAKSYDMSTCEVTVL